MSIALSGSHRVGKSTLAQAAAKELDWAYVPSRAGEVAAAMGVDFSKKVPPDVVIEMQEGILAAHLDDLSGLAGKPWIADRSALDMATYCTLYALNQAHPRQARRVLDYIERCFEAVNRHCSAIVLVQPGIPYVAAEGKPPPDDLYQEAFNTHVWGLIKDQRLHAQKAYVPRRLVDLEHRVQAVVSLVGKLTVIGRSRIPEGVTVS